MYKAGITFIGAEGFISQHIVEAETALQLRSKLQNIQRIALQEEGDTVEVDSVGGDVSSIEAELLRLQLNSNLEEFRDNLEKLARENPCLAIYGDDI